MVATLLTLMDGLSDLKDVVVIGTTNRLDALDPALRRSGRFEHEIHIGVPDTAGRQAMLAVHTRRMPLSTDVDVDVTTLAARTYGFVGADLAALCQQAAYQALRRVHDSDVTGLDEAVTDKLTIGSEDFERALASARPSAMREVLVEIPRDVSWESLGGVGDIKRLLIENVVYGNPDRTRVAATDLRRAVSGLRAARVALVRPRLGFPEE